MLKRSRIRRFDAEQVLAVLRQRPVVVQDGAVAAATAHIETIVARTRLVNQQKHVESWTS